MPHLHGQQSYPVPNEQDSFVCANDLFMNFPPSAFPSNQALTPASHFPPPLLTLKSFLKFDREAPRSSFFGPSSLQNAICSPEGTIPSLTENESSVLRSVPDSHPTGSRDEIAPRFHVTPPSRDVSSFRISKKAKIGKGKDSHAFQTRTNALIRSVPFTETRKDDTGHAQGYMHIFGKEQNIRGPLTEEKRKATARTRSIGACENCRTKKQECKLPQDPSQPCRNCARRKTLCIRQPKARETQIAMYAISPASPYPSRVPVDLSNIHLHRLGSASKGFLLSWLKRLRLVPIEPRRILINQEIGSPLEVEVLAFKPIVGSDRVAYSWFDSEGQEQKVRMPPYYISNMTELCRNMDAYIQANRDEYLAKLLCDANPIIFKTFKQAQNYAQLSKHNLVSAALHLWTGTRLIERTWRICGFDTLDMQPFSEPNNPWHGMIPVTPVMDTLLDELVITRLISWSEGVLNALDTRIGRRECWFESFLTIFILMSSMEFVLEDMLVYSKRHGIQAQNRGKTSLSDGYVDACKRLLDRFHSASEGIGPLSTSTEKIHNLTADQRTFLQDLRNEVAQQKTQLDRLKGLPMYGTKMFWCNQVLHPGWKHDQWPISHLLEYTEDDFLTS